MQEADRLNVVLAEQAPAVFASLSPLGRAAAFPKGIPWQSTQAKNTRRNATIGQLTDGRDLPLPLPRLASAAAQLDPVTTFLYSPVSGWPTICAAWGARQRRNAGSDAPATAPIATHGLTHGLSIVADLFADAQSTILIPKPAWENYALIFGMRTGARIAEYDCFDLEARFDAGALGRALDDLTGRVIVILNFPANPSGYAPSAEERAEIVSAIQRRSEPTVAVVDDAYLGVVHDPTVPRRSLYWDLAEVLDPATALAVKVDGATKELLFFASRLGFLTFSIASSQAEEALRSKVQGVVRGTVGGPPGPSQALAAVALADPGLEDAIADRLTELRTRWEALRAACAALPPSVQPLPFNGAYFATFRLHGVDAEALRQWLISHESVGVVALPEENAVRVAYCSTTAEDQAEIVAAIVRGVEALS
jgi:aspartate/methionine/tyrosine aminotransferase